jgi:hypothetical protein
MTKEHGYDLLNLLGSLLAHLDYRPPEKANKKPTNPKELVGKFCVPCR